MKPKRPKSLDDVRILGVEDLAKPLPRIRCDRMGRKTQGESIMSTELANYE